MNEYEKAIDALDLEPYRQGWCCICGAKKDHAHHAVFRSHGGKDRHIVHLCERCHGEVHKRRLHFIAVDGELYFWGSAKAVKVDFAAMRINDAIRRGTGEYYNLKHRNEAYKTLWESY